MNEAETRAELIDPALAVAGWGVVTGSRIRREQITMGRLLGQNRRGKPIIADYVLYYNNKKLAVIEAKARDLYYTEGVGQAKEYAQRLQVRFTYSTNGVKIYGIDMDTGMEGDVASFPSPQELWERTYPAPITKKEKEVTNWRKKFADIPFEDRGGTWQPRYYQENAVNKTLDAVAKGKDRALLTLATGTGKTAIAFQIAWKLYHSRWNLTARSEEYHARLPRILFLADRNILADQAFNAFNAFEDDALVRIYPGALPSEKEQAKIKSGELYSIKKKGKVPKNGSIFFTIFQTFTSGPESKPYFDHYPKDFFDFIIIDECHRGGANDESSWRTIMEHFSPAVQLGLTATPKRNENTDTYQYFGDPVYIYSLKEGINDGFLTPFKVKEFKTTIDTYTFTDDDDVEDGELEPDREYTEQDFNRIIEIKQREEFRVKLFLEHINQQQKALVFCATQIHAAAVRDLINQHADSNSVDYCHRVTANDGKLGEQHLRDFQDNEKSVPTILTTSQKLSTGVDAPEIRSIVLMRPVNSMVEFKQIVGRGTRLFDGKDYFTIFDFVEAHHHFKDPAWDGEPLDPVETPPRQPKKPCATCGQLLCICINEPPPPCLVCGNEPCICDTGGRKIVKVKLSDFKVRSLDSMVKTTFWSPEGKPIGAPEFVKQLFGDIPQLFANEEQLRKIWSLPDTRKKLLEALVEKGYTEEQLLDLQRVIHGEDSDIFDVLSYIAYESKLVPRSIRAEKAKIHFNSYNPEQQQFLNFVLEQYVESGVKELDDAKLSELLVLKYNAIADAKTKLGSISSIRNLFIGFQEYLYRGDVG